MAEPPLVAPNGQADTQRILQGLLLPATVFTPVNTAVVEQALEAVVQATLPSRDDVAAQALAGTSLDAARPAPTDPRVVFAAELLESKTGVEPAVHDAIDVLRELLVQVPLRAQSLIPLVFTAVTQILRLTNYHAPTREIGARLIEALLTSPLPPQPPSDSPDAPPPAPAPLAPIAIVLNQLDASKATHDTASDAVTLNAFDLLVAILTFAHGKYAAITAPLVPWSHPGFLRLGLMRRRHFASAKAAAEAKKKAKSGLTPKAGQDDATLRGYDPASITPAQPDIRTRFVQLILATLAAAPLDLPILAASVVVPSWGSAPGSQRKRKRTDAPTDQAANNAEPAVVPRIRPGGYKPAVLSLAHEALANMFQGLPHDPAWLVARVLQDLHDHVLAPADATEHNDRLPRRLLMASLGSQGALDSLLALYGRHDIPLQDEDGLDVRLTRSQAADARRRRRVARGGPAYEQGEVVPQPIPGMPPIADQVHALLLALTTFRGRGMVFIDDGWYPRQNTRSLVGTEKDADAFDDEDLLPSTLDHGGVVRAKPPATSELYNPVLLRLLRSLAPGKLPRHALLARAILAASPQLVPAYLSKSAPAHATATPIRPIGITDVGTEGGVSSAWLASTSFVGQVLAQPIPVPLDADGQIRAQPPPLPVVLAALLPAPPLERSVLLRALTAPDRLAQLSTMRLLLAALERLRRFAILCERAHDALPSDTAWAATWSAVRSAAIKALPDLPSLLGLLQKVEVASSQNVLLTDSVVSCLALYASALNRAHAINTSTPHLTAQCRLDTGRLLRLRALTSMLEPGQALPSSEAEASFGPLVALHVLQTIQSAWLADQFHGTPGASFDLLSDSPGGSPYLVVLLRLWLSERSTRVQQTAEEILDAVLGQSSLFALTPGEWKAWLYALRPEVDARPPADGQKADVASRVMGSALVMEDVLALIHECASRASKLFHKYLDLAQSLAPAEQAKARQAPVSPLLVAFVEQFAIRARKGILRDRPLGRVASFLARLLMSCRASGAAASSAISSLAAQCAEALNGADPPAAPGIKWLFSSTLPATEAQLGYLADAGGDAGDSPTDGFEAYSSADDLLEYLHTLERPLSPAQVSGLTRACTTHGAEAILFELDPRQEPVSSSNFQQTVGLSLIQGLIPREIEQVRVAQFTARIIAHALTVAATLGTADPEKFASLLSLLLRSGFTGLAATACITLLGKLPPQGWTAISKACTPLLYKGPASENETVAVAMLDGLLHSPSANAFALARPLLAFIPAERVADAARTSLSFLQQKNQPKDVLAAALSLLLESLPLLATSITDVPRQVLAHSAVLLSLPASLLESVLGALSLALRCVQSSLESVSSILAAAESTPNNVWDGLLANILLTHPSHLGEVEQWIVTTGPAQTKWLELLHALVLNPRASLPTDKVESMFTLFVRPALREQGRPSALALNVTAGLIQRGWMPVSVVAQHCLDEVRQGGRSVHLAPALINLATVLLSVGPTDSTVQSLSAALTEKLMLLLVRAFAEHKTDPEDVQPSLEPLAGLVYVQADANLALPTHLVLPVVEAIIRSRFGSPIHSVLASSLVRACAPVWGAAACTRLAALVIGNSRFRMVMRKGDKDVQQSRLPLALVLQCLASAGAAPADFAPALRGAYLGSLDAADRTLFAALQLIGTGGPAGPIEGLELANGGLGEETTSPMQQLASLDAERLKLTCRLFPRNRRFDATDAGVSRLTTTEPLAGLGAATSVAHEDVLTKLYDPLAILSLFASGLLGQEKPKRNDWVGVGSNYALGVVFCSLSSRASHVRALALAILGKVMGLVAGSSFPERELLLVPLQVLQEQVPLPSLEKAEIPALPLSSVLFASYVLDACISPEHGDEVGAVLARRAMHRARTQAFQRARDEEPTVPGPIPVLRTFLEGKVEDADTSAGACARVWMLELAADALAQGGEGVLGSALRRLPDTLRSLWSELTVADPGAATGVSQPRVQFYTPTSGVGQTPALYGDANRAAAHAIARIWLNLCTQPLTSVSEARKRVSLLLYARAQQAALPSPPLLWTTLAARTALGLPSSPTAWAATPSGEQDAEQEEAVDGTLAQRVDTLLFEVLCDGVLRGGVPDTAAGWKVVLDALNILVWRMAHHAAAAPSGSALSLPAVLLRAVEVLQVAWPGLQSASHAQGQQGAHATGVQPGPSPVQARAVFVQCLARVRRTLAASQAKDTLPLARPVDELTHKLALWRAQSRIL